jgi:hypothetical protein
VWLLQLFLSQMELAQQIAVDELKNTQSAIGDHKFVTSLCKILINNGGVRARLGWVLNLTLLIGVLQKDVTNW